MRYIDVLQDLVDSYNKSKHRSIQKRNRLTLPKRMNGKYGIPSMENAKRKDLSSINLK